MPIPNSTPSRHQHDSDYTPVYHWNWCKKRLIYTRKNDQWCAKKDLHDLWIIFSDSRQCATIRIQWTQPGREYSHQSIMASHDSASCDIMWHHVTPCDIIWHHMASCDITLWHHMIHFGQNWTFIDEKYPALETLLLWSRLIKIVLTAFSMH